MSIEDGKFPSVKLWYKRTCTACGRYWHKLIDLWHIEDDKNVPKYHYLNKTGIIKKDFHKSIRKYKSRDNNNEENKKKCNYCEINNYEKNLKEEKFWK